MRQFFVLMHRYVGLVMAVFLIIVGLTGALITFYDEIDGYINHDLTYADKPFETAPLIDPFTLRNKVLAQYPNANINYLELSQKDNHSAVFYLTPKINPVNNKPYTLKHRQIYVNPYTANIIGERNSNEISESWKNMMPFIFELHYALALGTFGGYVLGIVALFWTIDCFVGAYLTFPMQRQKMANKAQLQSNATKVKLKKEQSWSARWWKSWKIRWNGGFHKVNFDFHRAGGLWLWAVLLVFAWSSVAFNLGDEIYSPVTKFIFMQEQKPEIKKLAVPLEVPVLSFEQAFEIGKSLMATQAQLKGFSVIAPQAISYKPAQGIYQYRVKSSRDVNAKYGSTRVTFDANSGQFIVLSLPSGEDAGDTLTSWIVTLHMAKIWGLPMQIFVCLMGLVITGLSITGVIIWLKKRKSRAIVHQLKNANIHKKSKSTQTEAVELTH
ncbi:MULTISPECIES: PepSY-associated TM helix domain-containing protein [Methylotenera]|uniref:PepSY-associated TM helix domain-containing protein n=1 Tax=Methylotenera TaxID=359407 RepID=UPI00037828D6|nr:MULTISPECIES: PepSY-associated TM helix domain-containing protein [Methylotenera]